MRDSETDPSVTVLIDTYNYAHFIGRAIESVLAQTYPPSRLEVLVMDDGSTDDTAAVVSRFGDGVRYILKPNGGQASALNAGFREVRGEIVCLLDADDYFYANKVRRVADLFRAHPEVGVVYNRLDVVLSDGSKLKEDWPTFAYAGNLESRTLLGYSWGPPTSAISLRKSALERITIPEDTFRICPDHFLTSIMPLVAEVGVVETTESVWYFHGGNKGLLNDAFTRDYGEHTRRFYAAIRRYAADRLGKRFVTYGGRSAYGLGIEQEWSGSDRAVAFVRDARQIAAADVDGAIKLEAGVKLVTSLLPRRTYTRLKEVKDRVVLFYLREFMHHREGDHDLNFQAQKEMAAELLHPRAYARLARDLGGILFRRLRSGRSR